MREVKVPDLGSGVEGATVSMWHYAAGDSIKQDDNLVELVTDKATFEVPSPVSGKVMEITVPEGAAVKAGDVLAVVEEKPR
jgi:pyruvate dehydrogenase E2 component (dihydrolipoamide acetyltransferase)